MRGMTKVKCLEFEKLAINELTKVLGKPHDEYEDGSSLEWIMPHGATGHVRFRLICDSKEVGNVYRSSWLACRISDPRFVKEDGYTKNQSDIEGGWPYPFTYPSGKYNLHPGDHDSKESMKSQLAQYLYSIAPYGSREKEEFGKIRY